MAHQSDPTVSISGTGAFLLDGATGGFSDVVQRRVWVTASSASAIDGVLDCVPGMNNLLVSFDPLLIDPSHMRERLLVLWREADDATVEGHAHEFPVIYGGQSGEDLGDWAKHCGMSVDAAVKLHAAGDYVVAAIGAMPGFPYLSGLDSRLALGRRSSPRAKTAEGSVMIGGSQAGIMPMTAPSGWHILGHTNVRLFDPLRDPPALLRPGDRVRFTVTDIIA